MRDISFLADYSKRCLRAAQESDTCQARLFLSSDREVRAGNELQGVGVSFSIRTSISNSLVFQSVVGLTKLLTGDAHVRAYTLLPQANECCNLCLTESL